MGKKGVETKIIVNLNHFVTVFYSLATLSGMSSKFRKRKVETSWNYIALMDKVEGSNGSKGICLLRSRGLRNLDKINQTFIWNSNLVGWEVFENKKKIIERWITKAWWKRFLDQVFRGDFSRTPLVQAVSVQWICSKVTKRNKCWHVISLFCRG